MTEENKELPIHTQEELAGFRRYLVPLNKPIAGTPVKLNREFILGGVLKVDATVTTVANTTTKTTLNSYSFPSNGLWEGCLIRITALGVFSTANAVDQLSLIVGAGGVAEVVATASYFGATVTNETWNLTWYGIVSGSGPSGTLESQLRCNIYNTIADDGNASAYSIDLSSAQSITLSADWDNALAGNTVSIRQFIVEIF